MLRTKVPKGEQGQSPARLIGWQAGFYWNEEQTEPLPLGGATLRGLRHHIATAAFPDALIQSVFNGGGTTRVTAEQLEKLGGYTFDGTCWWNPGDVWVYAGANAYFALTSTIDPFGASTAYEWDPYALLVAQVTNALGNVVTISNDYRALLPAKIVDVNDVTSEALFSPLGYLLARTATFPSHRMSPARTRRSSPSSMIRTTTCKARRHATSTIWDRGMRAASRCTPSRSSARCT